MLWKKESRQSDALYIDFFPSGTKFWEQKIKLLLENADQKPIPMKSDTISLKKRNKGNEKFREEKLLDAMELYSDSLRYANPRSEHISLAYANRAACFLKLKMYNECLADIELAEQADYPEHLRPKLERRKDECMKEMQKNPNYSRDLSIESNEQYPYLANVAKIQRNGTNGDYSVVATTDIDVGQPIVVEEPQYTYQYDRFGAMCNICLKEYCNLVPCEKCASAMFCSKCQGHFLHKHECGLYFCGLHIFNNITMGVVRDVLLILNAFDNDVDELMSCVDKMVKKPKELPDNLLDDRSKFQILFSTAIQGLHKTINDLAEAVYPPYKTIMRIPRIKEMFKSTKHHRFLMHLIGHQGSISADTNQKNGMLPEFGFDQMTYRIKTVMRTFFQESCCPNVRRFNRDGKTIWYSVKSIKMGKQLLIKNTPDAQMEAMRQGRFNKKEANLKCECHQCKGKTLSPEQRNQLTSDPDYRFIQMNKARVQVDEMKLLMNACVSVLRRYGEWNWCKEILDVTHLFNSFQSNHMIGEMDHLNYAFLCAFGLKSHDQYIEAKFVNMMQMFNNF